MKSVKKYIEGLKQSPMYPELLFIIKASAAACVASFLISLLWGFDYKLGSGLLVGYLYLVFCYLYLAACICKAVDTGNVKKAKRQMFSCYMLRYSGVFLLCWLAYETEALNVVGIILPQLFPRIVLWLNQILKRGNGNGRT